MSPINKLTYGAIAVVALVACSAAKPGSQQLQASDKSQPSVIYLKNLNSNGRTISLVPSGPCLVTPDGEAFCRDHEINGDDDFIFRRCQISSGGGVIGGVTPPSAAEEPTRPVTSGGTTGGSTDGGTTGDDDVEIIECEPDGDGGTITPCPLENGTYNCQPEPCPLLYPSICDPKPRPPIGAEPQPAQQQL